MCVSSQNHVNNHRRCRLHHEKIDEDDDDDGGGGGGGDIVVLFNAIEYVPPLPTLRFQTYSVPKRPFWQA